MTKRRAQGWACTKKHGTKNKKQAAKRDAALLLNVAREETLTSPTTAAATQMKTQPKQSKQRQLHTSPHDEKVKRATVEYFFERMQRPPREQWDGPSGVVLQIRDLMMLPRGEQKHTRTIRRVLEQLCTQIAKNPWMPGLQSGIYWIQWKMRSELGSRVARFGASRGDCAPFALVRSCLYSGPCAHGVVRG